MPVFCSPALRTRETANALELRTPVVEPSVIEMDWGEWEGQTIAQLRDKLGDAMAVNEDRGLDFQPDGGESPRQVQRRVLAWMASVQSRHEQVMVVTHKGVIRAVLAAAHDWNMMGRAPAKLDWSRCHEFRLGRDGQLSPGKPNLSLEETPTGQKGSS